jgi:hypothetical protein
MFSEPSEAAAALPPALRAALHQNHLLQVAARTAVRPRAGVAGPALEVTLRLAAPAESASRGCRPRRSSQPWPPVAGRLSGQPGRASLLAVALAGQAAGVIPEPVQHQVIRPDRTTDLLIRSLGKADPLCGNGCRW